MKRCLSALLALLLLLTLSLPGVAADTGIQSAADVEYKTFQENGKTYTANWGTRGDICQFLSPYAQDYYTDTYAYTQMSAISGGTKQSDAHESALYLALQKMMQKEHTHQTSYGETRYLYMYTDCERSETETILSFYSGTPFSSKWDQGATWNREHVWPNSKSLEYATEGRVSNSDRGEGADIMMLRPTLKAENAAENDAFGESSGCQIAEPEIRGDVARDLLYVYVRWGNVKYMWGKSGVMENVQILLRWMQEDPVDTWEMGRNDAVQSITGNRNVFVDFPEYAFLLFGQQIPADMVTPYKAEREKEPSVDPTVPTEPTLPPETQPTAPTVTIPSTPAVTQPQTQPTVAPTQPPVQPPTQEAPSAVDIVIVVIILIGAVVIFTRKRK